MLPHTVTAPSWPVSIHIAGDYAEARRICQDYCDKNGLCVTVLPVDYIYTNGNEPGVRIGLINYPRFPKTPKEIEEIAFKVAMSLKNGLGQESFSIETPLNTIWFSWRDQDTKAA